jgi:hypothetical protein
LIVTLAPLGSDVMVTIPAPAGTDSLSESGLVLAAVLVSACSPVVMGRFGMLSASDAGADSWGRSDVGSGAATSLPTSGEIGAGRPTVSSCAFKEDGWKVATLWTIHFANPLLVTVTVNPTPTGEIRNVSGVKPAGTSLILTVAPLGSDLIVTTPVFGGTRGAVSASVSGGRFAIDAFDPLAGSGVSTLNLVCSRNGTGQ